MRVAKGGGGVTWNKGLQPSRPKYMVTVPNSLTTKTLLYHPFKIGHLLLSLGNFIGLQVIVQFLFFLLFWPKPFHLVNYWSLTIVLHLPSSTPFCYLFTGFILCSKSFCNSCLEMHYISKVFYSPGCSFTKFLDLNSYFYSAQIWQVMLTGKPVKSW